MDASRTFGREISPLVIAVRWRLARVVAITGLVLLLTTGLLVAVRRVGGRLEPLDAGALAMLGVALAASAWAIRTVFPLDHRAHAHLMARCVSIAVSMALAIWLTAAPTAGLLAWLALAMPVVLSEVWSWRKSGRRVVFSTLATERVPLRPFPLTSVPVVVVDEEETEESAVGDADISQQITRRREAAGEVIEGWLRAPVAAGQRHATAHIAICPPLEGIAEGFAEQCDGPSANVRVGLLLPQGVRFDVKLDQPAEHDAAVTIEFTVRPRAVV